MSVEEYPLRCPFTSFLLFRHFFKPRTAVMVATVGNWWIGTACITLIIQYLWNSSTPLKVCRTVATSCYESACVVKRPPSAAKIV